DPPPKVNPPPPPPVSRPPAPQPAAPAAPVATPAAAPVAPPSVVHPTAAERRAVAKRRAQRRAARSARARAAAAKNLVAGHGRERANNVLAAGSGSSSSGWGVAFLVVAFSLTLLLFGLALTPAWAVPWSRASRALEARRD